MNEGEKRIQIDNQKDQNIIEYPDSPRVRSDDDFDKAYNKGLNANGVNFFDVDTKVIKKTDGSFLIGREQGDGTIKELMSVENLTLLKSFVYYLTDKYSRNIILNQIGGQYHDKIKVEAPETTDPNTKEKTTEIVLSLDKTKEALDVLHNEVSMDQILESVKDLELQRRELKELIRKQRPGNNEIYRQNLLIFSQIIDAQNDNNIQNIKREAKSLKDNTYDQNHPLITTKWANELDHIHAQYSQIEIYLTDPTLMSKPFDASTYNTDLAIYSVSAINSLQQKIGVQDIQTAQINAGEFNTALIKLDLDDRQRFRVYLNQVIANQKDPAKEKYKPENEKAFRDLCAQFPFLLGYIEWSGDKNYNRITNPSNQGNINNTPNNYSKGNVEKIAPSYGSFNESFAKGGVGGFLDYSLQQTNMTPNQRKFWGGVGNLALIGGGIFVGWKFLSSAFKLFTKKGREDNSNRGRALGVPAAFMTIQGISGDSPLNIFKGGKITEKISSLWGGSGVGNSIESDTYAKGFVGISALFQNMNYGEMSQFIEKTGDKMKIKGDQYESLVDLFENGNKKSKEAVDFLRSIGKSDKKGIIDLALNAMGISREKLTDPDNKDKKFNVTASEAIVRLKSLYGFMEKKGYDKINTETMYLVKKYISDGDSKDDLEDLEARGDVFEKEMPFKDKTGLEAKVKLIAKGDVIKQEEILKALNLFYDKFPSSDKTIDMIDKGNNIVSFKTYGHTTDINLKEKTIVGLDTGSDKFSSYLELFKAANLTNRIRFVCKSKKAAEADPFKISIPGSDIEFNDAKTFSLSTDTEIVSAGWGGSLKTISPLLENKKQEYVNYLNKNVSYLK